jgi:hypothetical protein
MEAMDAINARHGAGTLKYSAEGGPNPIWALRRDMLSEASTTDWSSLPMAKA